MMRRLILASTAVLVFAPLAAAQDWAAKMFKVRSHDYGIVARNAKTVFEFELENPYAVDVHIAGVRASCGCTTPQVTDDTLTTYEKGSILAIYNTDKFLGKRGATLTVTFDKPRFAEVQLTVTGFIRSDVLVEPGAVEFGAVDQSTPAEKTAKIRYYGGTPGWAIQSVECNNPHLEVACKPIQGQRGAYDLLVRLKPTSPEGYFTDQVTLTTNDSQVPKLPVTVEGQIVAPITISPSNVLLGVVQHGQQVQQKLIIRGKEPFKILGIEPNNDRLQFKFNDSAKKLHIVPFTFTAGNKTTKVIETVKIQTDLGDTAVTCTLSAAVVDAVASN